MNFSVIILIVLLAVTLIAIGLAVLFGFRRNIVQTGVRAGCFILAVILGMVLAATLTPVLLSSILSLGGDSVVGALGDYLASGSSAAEQLGDVLSAALAPAFFLVFFILISLIFLIAYIVLSSLLFSDKALEKKNKSVPHTKPLFGVNIAAHVIFSLAIVSVVLMPVSYYATVAGEYVDASDTEETEVTSLIEAADDNVLLNVYGAIGSPLASLLTTVKTDSGDKTTIKELAEALIPAVTYIMSAASSVDDLMTSTVCYQLATYAESNSYLNTLIGGLLSDAGTAWANGDTFLTIEPIMSSDSSLASSVYAALAGSSTASVELRGVAIALSFSNVVSASGETVEETKEVITQEVSDIAANVTEESAEVAKSLMTEEVLSSLDSVPEENAGAYSSAVSDVIDGLVALKSDTSATDEETQQKLEEESAAIAEVFTLVTSPSETNISDVVSAVVSSDILQTTVQNATDNGTTNDPFGIADSLTDEQVAEVETALAAEGVEVGSDLYNAIMALVNK